MFKGSIHTITKAGKFIRPLSHPIFEYKPPMLDLVQVWRIGGKIPQLTSSLCHNLINYLGAVETGVVNDNDIPWLQLG